MSPQADILTALFVDLLKLWYIEVLLFQEEKGSGVMNDGEEGNVSYKPSRWSLPRGYINQEVLQAVGTGARLHKRFWEIDLCHLNCNIIPFVGHMIDCDGCVPQDFISL